MNRIPNPIHELTVVAAMLIIALLLFFGNVLITLLGG